MSKHYKTFSAVFPLLFMTEKDKKYVLLAKRENTGYMDGMWDLAGSGHVDENETAMQALVREAKEEIGIRIEVCDVKFAHLSHRLGMNGNRTYYDIYFSVERFSGEPTITEPEKCSDLKWFDIECLPSDMIGLRKEVLRSYLESMHYSEVIID